MRNPAVTLVSVLVLLVSMCLPVFAQNQDAKVLSVQGNSFIVTGSSSAWQKLTTNTVLKDNDRIVTGASARVELNINGSTISLSPFSDFRIKLVPDVQVSSSNRFPQAQTTVQLNSGSLRARVQRAEAGQVRFQVRSPEATASVRGTDFSFDGQVLEVSEGDVQLQNLTGQSHSVRAGQESRAYGYQTIRSVEKYLRENTSL